MPTALWHRPACRARPSMPCRRPRCTLGAGMPPRVPRHCRWGWTGAAGWGRVGPLGELGLAGGRPQGSPPRDGRRRRRTLMPPRSVRQLTVALLRGTSSKALDAARQTSNLMEGWIMSGVNQLGYLIIGVSDLAGWRGLSSSVLGLELVPGDSRSTTYLRMDEHHHRIELRNGGSDDLEVIGWEVPDAETLHAVAQRLENAGVRVRSGTSDEADQRRVIELIGFEDT